MRAAAWFDQLWERFVSALIRSPALTLAFITLFAAIAVVVGSLITPPTNVNSIPFVLPTLIATFQGVRWVWMTAVIMLAVYLVVAFGVEDVPLSSALVSTFGLVLFGTLLTWLSRDRQRTRNQAAALEDMERNLTLATRRSNVRMFTQDVDLRYTWVVEPSAPFTLDEVLGATDADLFPPEEASQLTDIKRKAMVNEREFRQEVRATMGGDPRIFDLTAVPNFTEIDGETRVSGVTCIAVDITDMRQIISEREELVCELETTLAQVARAQDNLERFTSMIAHDLMQPLTVIQGHVSLLRQWMDPTATERQRRALDSLSRSISQMRHLIDDLRDVAALERGKFSLDTYPVDFVSVLREVASDYQSTAETHRINVQTPEYLWIHLDPSRISQLIGNLLSNAIKYSPGGGDIDVTVTIDRYSCHVAITDQGLGMPPDEFGALFEKFSRLENSQSIQGLGLGLYISKGIAQAHGGDITVESEPGAGSTFTVTLPLGPRVNIETPLQQTSEPEKRISGK